MTNLRGKNILITGGARGIGRLLARKTVAEGAHAILWDIDAEGVRSLAAALEAEGGRATAQQCDVSDREAVKAAARSVLEELGPVDILINNAGVVSGRPILDASDDDIKRTFDINTLAHFWTTRGFLPSMIERDSGHIVTIASAGGLVGAPRLTDYSASKFAAVGFDESLRLELKRQGSKVKTTLVCPFYSDTGMFEGVKTRFSWLLPILDPDYVATQTVKAIKKNRRRLFMPRFIYVAPPLRLLPVPIFDALVGFFGVTRSMDDFEGR